MSVLFWVFLGAQIRLTARAAALVLPGIEAIPSLASSTCVAVGLTEECDGAFRLFWVMAATILLWAGCLCKSVIGKQGLADAVRAVQHRDRVLCWLCDIFAYPVLIFLFGLLVALDFSRLATPPMAVLAMFLVLDYTKA